MNLIDCHSHTVNSPDADDSVFAMCERASSLGLSAYAITDHCEANRFYSIEYYKGIPNDHDTYDFDISFEKSMAENTSAKEKFAGKLNLICGIELGQGTHDLTVADKIVSDKRLDFVIGSMHELYGIEDFCFMDYSKYDVKELLHKYFKEIYELCIWNKFDVLGHLTYTLRYIEGENGIKVDLTPYNDIIREIFKLIIQNGKGIEINTSGLRQKYGKTFPALEYVKLFHDLGGEIISIGSDSHCTQDIGKGVAEGAEIAKAAGFKRLCYFKERKPVFINID